MGTESNSEKVAIHIHTYFQLGKKVDKIDAKDFINLCFLCCYNRIPGTGEFIQKQICFL
jgi:hypothetical protein